MRREDFGWISAVEVAEGTNLWHFGDFALTAARQGGFYENCKKRRIAMYPPASFTKYVDVLLDKLRLYSGRGSTRKRTAVLSCPSISTSVKYGVVTMSISSRSR